MRKTTTLSTIVIAVIVAALTVQNVNAQSGNGSGYVPQQPRYTPPKTTHRDHLVRPAGFQEEVEVPSILSGKSETSPVTAPPTSLQPPVAPSQTRQESPKQQVVAPPTAASPFKQANSLAPRQLPPQQLPRQQLPQQVPLRTGTPGVSPIASGMPAQTVPTQDPSQFESSPINQVSATEAANSLRGQLQTAAGHQELSPPSKLEPAASFNTSIPQISSFNSGHNGQASTDGPKLRVTSTGPSSVTIGKKAQYEVKVENLEARSANSVIVGIDFPQWVEVTSIMPSTGSKETTDGTEESLMIWQIPIVEANSTEKILIEVIPREARAFDIDVEWTFKPIRGKTTVEVTQPQLAIQIAGPTEVQFGEKALYDVTVSNPGTGIAENVSVMLPDALGGERAKLDNIAPQQQKKFQVELIARSAGTLDLTTTVVADGNLKESDTREIVVRRAVLKVDLEGPGMKYAGSVGTYNVTVSNQGDAMARDVIAAVALPHGVEFVSGIDNVEKIDGGIRWNVGMLSPGNQRSYQLNCNMTAAGSINLEAAARGAGELAATDKFVTKVDAVADLVLAVADPKGPLPTGQKIEYEIRITNRGTKSARGVNIVMHFSEGVEPAQAEGIANEIAPGQVTFAPIAQIDPGQDIVLKVLASASQPGSHRFRAQLLCEEADSHEVAEGTTRFFGEASTSTAENETENGGGQFKR